MPEIAQQKITATAVRLHDRYGISTTRRLSAALSRIAYIESGLLTDRQEYELANTTESQPDDSLALARWYADLLDALDVADQSIATTVADAANDELDGSGWQLERDARGRWKAVDVSEEPEGAELSLSWELATQPRSVGEKWQGKSGRWFTKRRDGRVVPTKAPNAASPGVKARTAEKHKNTPSSYQPVRDRLAKYGTPDYAAHHDWNAGNSRRIAKAFIRHHGDAAITRLDDLSSHLENALDKLKGDDWKTQRARSVIRTRLLELHHAFKHLPVSPIEAKSVGDLKPQIVIARPEHTKPADVSVVPEHLRGFLVSGDGSDHQLQGAAMAISGIDREGGFLLADGTGAGKTRQILAVAQAYAMRGKKAVIVAPAGIIKPDWKGGSISGSVGKDGAAMGVSLQLNRGDRDIASGEVHVTTYEQLAAMKERVDADTVVIFDESHGLKNAESARAAHGKDMAARAMGVVYGTATPADSAADLAYLFRTKLYGDEPWERVRKRLDPDRVGPAEALKNTSEMFDRLTAMGVMVKREISLDGIETHFDHVHLSEEGKQALESMKAGATTKDRAQVLMRQRFAQEKLKIPHAVNMVGSELAEGRQVVIFVAGVGGSEDGPGTAGQLREALAKSGVNPDQIAELHGGEGGGGREVVEAFQKGGAKVIITTAQSGGTGHNLDDTVGNAPRTQILLTAPFSAIDNAQIWGRTHRLTTKSKSRIRYVFADTEVDRWNADLIRGKVQALGAIVQGEATKQNIPEFASPGEQPATTMSAVTEEAMAWQPYIGPRGGRGWVKGDEVVYGERPGGSGSARQEQAATPTPVTKPGSARTPEPAKKPETVGEKAQFPYKQPEKPIRRSSVSLMLADKPPPIQGTGDKGRISALDVAKWLSKNSEKQGGKLTKKFDEKAKQVLSDALVDETAYALSKDGNAMGWYDAKVKEAMGYVYKTYPELKADPNKDAVFKLMLAITSQGVAVHDNFKFAAKLWEHYRDHGKVNTTDTVYGTKAKAINTNLQALQELIDEKGMTGNDLRAFLAKKVTVSEWKKAGYKISGELAETVLPGAMIFGPKIGSFFGNLNGDYSTVTMDMWFMRTFNRMCGTLTDPSPEAMKKQAKRIASVIGAMQESEWESVSGGMDRKTLLAEAARVVEFGDALGSENLVKWANHRLKEYEKSGFKDKSPANLSAKQFAVNLSGINEAPGGGNDRKWMRQVMDATQEKLRAKGINLTNADLQALLWYHEKNLWSKMGYRAPKAKPADYATAARAMWEEKNAGRQ